MNIAKTLLTLALLAILVPGAQANSNVAIECEEIIQSISADADASNSNAAYAADPCGTPGKAVDVVIALAGGCTTTFAYAEEADALDFERDQVADTNPYKSAMTGNVNTWEYHLLYDPLAVMPQVGYATTFALDSAFDTLDYGLDTANNGLNFALDTESNAVAFVNCAV